MARCRRRTTIFRSIAMKRIAALTLALLISCVSASPALAASSIVVGNYVYSWSIYELDLYVTGDDQISSLDLGIVLSGPPGPVITAIDITGPGTIFAGNNVGQLVAFAPDDLPGLTPYVITAAASGTVLANGLLARVTIDMTNGPLAPNGAIWNLSLTSHELGSTILYGESGEPVSLSITNGSLFILPEPSAIALGLCGGMGVGLFAGRARRRRRKH
jgi:hypothetical protein